MLYKGISAEIDFPSFEKHESLYFAARKKDRDFLQLEFEARQKAGFDVMFLNESDIKKTFGFKAEAAILSKQGATTDAYLFTHQLLKAAMKNGLQVFDKTEVQKTIRHRDGVTLTTTNGCNIKARVHGKCFRV